jgi:hypothetical protein
MAQGRILFARLVELLPRRAFESAVARYAGDRRVRSLSCMDQLVAMIYGQLTGRTSLRETVLCLHALGAKRYHCGIRRAVARSSLADANELRDWRIFRDTALALIARARGELPADPELQALDAEVYAFDSTTIVLCLKLFPGARAYHGKAAVKLHTLLDLHTEIPVFITLSDARQHDMEALDTLEARVGAYYVMDRGYVDFARLYRLHQAGAFFVTRAKRNMTFVVRARQPAAGAVLFDQIIRLRGYRSRQYYPDMLRRIGYVDPETGKRLVFLTNNQALSAETIALLYHHRWRIELFFKWIKQNLRIKAFYGRSENAVCVQVWVAVITFVLVLRFRHRHQLPQTPSEVMSVFSAMTLEKTPINQVFREIEDHIQKSPIHKQLSLLEL